MVKIKKERKAIIAYTSTYTIKGEMFTPPGSRLSDFIGGLGQKKFLPISNATVTDVNGKKVCDAGFMELNKDEIVFLIPQCELKDTGEVD